MNLRPTHYRFKSAVRTAATLLSLALSSVSYAQLPQLGGETLAHPVTAQHENEPAIAMDAAGNYVVAYTHLDGVNAGINVQRFNRNGTPVGAAIVPMDTLGAVQQDASIAMTNDGRFVVVWEDNGARGGNNFDVKYALYNANGSTIVKGTANATLSGVRENARVSMNRATGEFVVVFAGGSSQSSVNVYYRRFSAAGVALDASDVRVNTGANNNTSLPSVALAANGNFIVAWEADAIADNNWEATFQRYHFGTALPQGSNTIASAALHDTTNVDVACDEEGNFVLAWVDGLPASSTDPKNLLYRVYNAAGAGAPAPLTMKSGAYSGNGDTSIPRIRVAMADDQKFVVTYLDHDEIYGRFYDAAGAALGGEIHVNTTSNGNTGEYQTKPSVCINPQGNRAAIVWAGTGSTDNGGIHKQRFATPNVPPVLNSIGSKSTPELQQLAFTAAATEGADNYGDVIAYSLQDAPAGAVINPVTGQFTWTPTEAQGPGIYNVKFVATDNGEPVQSDEETVTITVTEANVAPTNLALSANTVAHAAPAGTVVGSLSATDTDLPAQTLTYSLVTGEGSDDNAKFTISGNELQVATPPNYTVQPTMSVRVQVSDSLSGSTEAAFSITVEQPTRVDNWSMYE